MIIAGEGEEGGGGKAKAKESASDLIESRDSEENSEADATTEATPADLDFFMMLPDQGTPRPP